LAQRAAQVTTVNDVVLYDVRTLAPYRAALETDDAVRARGGNETERLTRPSRRMQRGVHAAARCTAHLRLTRLAPVLPRPLAPRANHSARAPSLRATLGSWRS
jgi:hypothetical protein